MSKENVFSFLTAAATILGINWYLNHLPTQTPIVIPNPVLPEPAKHPPVRPHHPHLPWGAKVGGDSAPDGTPVEIDMPQDLRMHNVGGRDGAGLCVFTSINHAALWQNVDQLKDLQKWMRSKPGGGYPEKVDAMIKEKCGGDIPEYIQVEGKDLDVIDLACKTRRMPCITYSFSPSGRYGGQRISHMVNCVHADGSNYAILDNNYPEQLEWLTKQEFSKTYSMDGGWTFVLLHPGPPPVPMNLKVKEVTNEK